MLQKNRKTDRKIPLLLYAFFFLLLSVLLSSLCACADAGRQDSSFSSGEEEKPSAAEQLVAHAGGAVYGYRRTNSKEALDTCYRNGFRYIELDFQTTSDGRIVLIHDWDSMADRMFGRSGQMSAEEFLTSETFMNLTVMDLDDLLHWLRGHPSCFIITDIRPDNLTVLKEIADSAGRRAGQFIPQAYTFEEYSQITEMGYEKVILTLYSMTDFSGLSDFVRRQHPWAVTIPEEKLSEELIKELSGLGVRTFAHTINALDTWEYWHRYGLSGIYTDYLMPDHWDV